MYDSSFSFRTQESVKNQAFNVIKSYGMTPAQVFNMFLTQIATSHTIPLSLTYQQYLDEGYRAMAMDSEREKEAQEWVNALAQDGNAEMDTQDLTHETW